MQTGKKCKSNRIIQNFLQIERFKNWISYYKKYPAITISILQANEFCMGSLIRNAF